MGHGSDSSAEPRHGSLRLPHLRERLPAVDGPVATSREPRARHRDLPLPEGVAGVRGRVPHAQCAVSARRERGLRGGEVKNLDSENRELVGG